MNENQQLPEKHLQREIGRHDWQQDGRILHTYLFTHNNSYRLSNASAVLDKLSHGFMCNKITINATTILRILQVQLQQARKYFTAVLFQLQ